MSHLSKQHLELPSVHVRNDSDVETFPFLSLTYSPHSLEGQRAGSWYKACVWSLVGDMEYLASVLKLPLFPTKRILVPYVDAVVAQIFLLGRIADWLQNGSTCNGHPPIGRSGLKDPNVCFSMHHPQG